MDGAFTLLMSTVDNGKEKVRTLRKRPKITANNAAISRVPFGDEPTRLLWIPRAANGYNYNMGYFDQFDQLTAQTTVYGQLYVEDIMQ